MTRFHPRKYDVRSAVEHAAKAQRSRGWETVFNEVEDGSAVHHRAFKTKLDSARAREAYQFAIGECDRAFISSDHVHPATERMADVGRGWLAIKWIERRSFKQYVCVAGLD